MIVGWLKLWQRWLFRPENCCTNFACPSWEQKFTPTPRKKASEQASTGMSYPVGFYVGSFIASECAWPEAVVSSDVEQMPESSDACVRIGWNAILVSKY